MQANIQRFAAKKEDAPTPSTVQAQQDRKECQHTGQPTNNTKPGRQCSSASLLSLLGSSRETSCKAASEQGNQQPESQTLNGTGNVSYPCELRQHLCSYQQCQGLVPALDLVRTSSLPDTPSSIMNLLLLACFQGASDKYRKRCRDEPLPPSSRRVHESHKGSGAGAAKRPLIPCSTQPAVFVLGADRSEVQRSRHRHPAQQQPHIGYFNHWEDGNGTWDHDSIGIDGVKEGELGWQTHGAAALSSGFGPR
ncbi:hypothetical protein QJQ45_025336 [Haematococcus lacustris]|nr:hypothetical protein QJQ45_025336 [Haematococcus lacustris]